MKLKKVESIVLNVLKRNIRARSDDFILVGGVLKDMGIDLKLSVAYVFANHTSLNIPSFETITRCRRHIQELMPELKDGRTAVKREESIEDFKEYNLTDIGGN